MLGVRIADYIKGTRAPSQGNLRTVFNERPSNATPPDIWFNEQTIQLCISIRSGLQRGEAGDTTAQFQDEHIPGSYLPDWQINGVRIGEQCLTVALIRQGCPELEVLKCGLLREDGVADDDCFHSRSLNGDQHSWVMTGNFRVGGDPDGNLSEGFLLVLMLHEELCH